MRYGLDIYIGTGQLNPRHTTVFNSQRSIWPPADLYKRDERALPGIIQNGGFSGLIIIIITIIIIIIILLAK